MKRNLARTAVASLLILLVVAVIGACTRPAAPPSPTQKPAEPAKPAPAPSPTAKPTAAAPAYKLPDPIIVTGYQSGTSGYTHTLAMGDGVMKTAGVRLRYVPAATDAERFTMLRGGDVQAVVSGVPAYFIAEGLPPFNTTAWGPLPLQIVWQASSVPAGGGMFITTKDSGIKSPTAADLKGKTLPWIPGDPSVIYPMTAFLAYANLTWQDVKRESVASTAAMYRGIVEGKVDIINAIVTSSITIELAASRRGIQYLPMPASEKEAWARYQKIFPIHGPAQAKGMGPEMDKNKVYDVNLGMYPMIVVLPTASEDFVYAFTKAIHQSFDIYYGAVPAMLGWRQDYGMVPSPYLPYHRGTVKYLKEIGKWTADHEAKNKEWMDHQTAMTAEWNKAIAEAAEKKIEGAKFEAFWLEKRKALLGDKFPYVEVK